ncbi:MAG: hypothetical protein IPM61_16775 [Chlorobi bacterium]|nr:hypothetical protein [Chlorobiota bacterium]
MPYSPITVVLRCSNQAVYANSPYKDITLYCWAVPPIPEQDALGETEVGIDGYLSQNIVQREKWQLLVEDFSVEQGDWDQGDFELLRRYLRARYLHIKSVTGSDRTNTTTGTPTDYDYWAAIGEANTMLPLAVVAKFDPPESDLGGVTIGCVITLTAALPQVGVSIT